MTKYEIKGYNKKCWLYSDKVKEHFFNPQNLFKSVEEEKEWEQSASGIGEVGNPSCGDVMRFYIKVKNKKITETRFKTFGCASAIASTSMLSVMVIGKTLSEAKKITWPSKKEVQNHTVIVIVTVFAVMIVYGLLDFGFSKQQTIPNSPQLRLVFSSLPAEHEMLSQVPYCDLHCDFTATG